MSTQKLHADAVADAIETHMTAVEAGQKALGDLLPRKQSALSKGDVDALSTLTAEEETLAAAFADLSVARDRILDEARAVGMRCASLRELADELGLSDILCERLDRAQQTARALRQSNMTQLVVASRASQHYDGLINIIASAGSEDPAYGQTQRTGGGLLNAEA